MRGQSEPTGELPPRSPFGTPMDHPPMARREGELIAEGLHHVARAIETLAHTVATRRG